MWVEMATTLRACTEKDVALAATQGREGRGRPRASTYGDDDLEDVFTPTTAALHNEICSKMDVIGRYEQEQAALAATQGCDDVEMNLGPSAEESPSTQTRFRRTGLPADRRRGTMVCILQMGAAGRVNK